MKLKELKDWVNSLPEDCAEFDIVNGDLTAGRFGAAGISSTTEGFVTGGATAPYTVQNYQQNYF